MKHEYLKGVSTLLYNEEKCIGCGICTDVCPHGVFLMQGKNAQIIDKNLCMECGACVLNCPANALEVNAGVGCAAAIIMSWFTGKEPTCGCDDEVTCC